MKSPDTAELRGRRAVVTGSTSGIGRAIVLELAAAGANVVVHGRSHDRADAVAAAVRALGATAQVCVADLREPAGCDRLVETVWSSGPCDIWVNNAGADTLTGDLARASFDDKLRELIEVDVLATVRLGRDVGQRMKSAGRGVILNIGWDQAETGMEGDSGQLFGITKGAVMAFTKSLAMTLAPTVRVNCLAPGWIRTAWGEQASNEWQQRAVREAPLARWGSVQDIADAVRFLASDRASFITGQILRVNGGAVR